MSLTASHQRAAARWNLHANLRTLERAECRADALLTERERTKRADAHRGHAATAMYGRGRGYRDGNWDQRYGRGRGRGPTGMDFNSTGLYGAAGMVARGRQGPDINWPHGPHTPTQPPGAANMGGASFSPPMHVQHQLHEQFGTTNFSRQYQHDNVGACKAAKLKAAAESQVASRRAVWPARRTAGGDIRGHG